MFKNIFKIYDDKENKIPSQILPSAQTTKRNNSPEIKQAAKDIFNIMKKDKTNIVSIELLDGNKEVSKIKN